MLNDPVAFVEGDRTVSTIKLLIVDDQKYVREGFRTILELEEDMEVIGIVENGKEACESAAILEPDVMLLDIQMPVMNGLEALRYIRANHPKIKVIILTTFAESDYILEGMAEGAQGYVMKDMDADRLIESIRDVMKGQYILPSLIAAKLAQHARELHHKVGLAKREVQTIQLTYREKELARLLVQGLSNQEVAEMMCIAEGTARNYISNLYSKIGVEDRTQAILLLQDLM
ncbi:response regulator transcription factor [Paenibacillus sp. PCH8]|uniref:response regulator transcription factor n=1 Tax=Paenibacillus sp. PCH8 TaxID=2066524 RepID=UPI0021570BD8|nr:response regulator transcription factor [Paenibacillus sp. PCH8]